MSRSDQGPAGSLERETRFELAEHVVTNKHKSAPFADSCAIHDPVNHPSNHVNLHQQVDQNWPTHAPWHLDRHPIGASARPAHGASLRAATCGMVNASAGASSRGAALPRAGVRRSPLPPSPENRAKGPKRDGRRGSSWQLSLQGSLWAREMAAHKYNDFRRKIENPLSGCKLEVCDVAA